VDELNAFYLKYLLWIPPAHYINTARITLHAFAGAVAVREAYQYFTDPRCKRLGAQAWLITVIIAVEVMICVKFAENNIQFKRRGVIRFNISHIYSMMPSF